MTITQDTGKHGTVDITINVESTDTVHLVTITAGRKQDHYWVESIPSDFGVGAMFQKLGTSDRHEVNLDTVSSCHECCCKGFARYGRCRHVAAAIVLHDAGLLRKSPRPEHAVEMPARVVNPCCFLCGKSYEACTCTI